MRRTSLCLAMGVLSANTLAAQGQLKKGETVSIKVPFVFLQQEGFKMGMTSGKPIYVADVQSSTGGVSVAGETDWMLAGFPSLATLKIEKIKHEDKKRYTEIEMRNDGAVVKLRFIGMQIGPSLEAAFQQTVVWGASDSPAAKAYLDEVYDATARASFSGPLADMPHEIKKTVVIFAHATANGTKVGDEKYKDQAYLVVDLGSHNEVFNSLQLNRSQRVARIVDDRLLDVLKAFGRTIDNVASAHGVKLVYRVPFRSFLDQSSANEIDELTIYAPYELIRRFADADITSQDLIDGSVVICNDNRMEVSLSES